MGEFSFEISAAVDESGFVLLVSPDGYSGFIQEDWTLEGILIRFVDQMNKRSLFAAYPGPDLADEPLRISGKALLQPCFRETSGLIRVGEAGLWLTDYPALTMAAQFTDEPPVKAWHLRLPVPAGLFRIVLRQLAGSWEDYAGPAVELLVMPANDREVITDHEAVPWFE